MHYEAFIDHLLASDSEGHGLVTLAHDDDTGHLTATVNDGAIYVVTLTPDNYMELLHAGAAERNAEASFNAWCHGMLHVPHFTLLMAELSDHMASEFAYYAALHHGDEWDA